MSGFLLCAAPIAFFVAACVLERGGHGQSALVTRRIGWILLTTLLVHFLSFVLMRATPGGPFDGDRALSPEIEARLRARYRLDDPVLAQWWESVSALARCDFGPSMVLRDLSVNDVLRQSAPTSLLVGGAAILWMILLGVPAGIVSATRRGSLLDKTVSLVAALWLAIPTFVLGSLLLLVLVFQAGILPAAGLDGVLGLILPSFCLGAPFAAQLARLLRTGLLEVLDQDWIRAAKARGLGRRAVLLRHALLGASPPVLAFLAPAVAGILTGSLVVESLFGIPGLGTHFVHGALNRDYPLALALVTVYTLLVATLTLLCDLLHARIDRRIRIT